jgi:tRNA dimethylallyltransferase
MHNIAERRGSATLHRALSRIDAPSAARISTADLARIIRAYEVYLLTGRPMSSWQTQQSEPLEGFRWLKLGIEWPRELLYRRIEARVERMFEAGFVEEVRELLKQFPQESHAFKAIGYRQIIDYLRGDKTLAQAVEETKLQSRRYAKRQLTWFRADPGIIWLKADQAEADLLGEARRLIRELIARAAYPRPNHL